MALCAISAVDSSRPYYLDIDTRFLPQQNKDDAGIKYLGRGYVYA